ncbi:MAG TPA: hypothetical protein VGC39_00800 [Candidatus Methylacidiphilales bacterium]
MPATITKNQNSQIIGGAFSNRDNADKAIQSLRDLGIADENIQVVVMLDDKQAESAFKDSLVGRGVSESQALFYDRAIRDGKILVAVHNVVDAAPVIEVFDDNKAEYNPDGSRNLREDVAGMTAGAAAGAVAGGVAGTVAAGPIGTAIGAAAGAVIGGGAGAAAGKAAEHRK